MKTRLKEFYDVSLDYILYNEKTSPNVDEVLILYQKLPQEKQEQVRDFIQFLKESK